MDFLDFLNSHKFVGEGGKGYVFIGKCSSHIVEQVGQKKRASTYYHIESWRHKNDRNLGFSIFFNFDMI